MPISKKIKQKHKILLWAKKKKFPKKSNIRIQKEVLEENKWS
jgi:hypothetical protein